MDTTKLITGILIIVFFIVKTILGDAKKEQEAKKAQQSSERPKTVFPDFFNDDEPQTEHEKYNAPVSPYMTSEERMATTSHMPQQSVMKSDELDEEQLQAHAERWRRAIIDSEVLKTKF